MSEEFDLVFSPHCKTITREGEELKVEIYGDGDGKWILEVVDQQGNSTVWDEHFDDDQVAFAEVDRTIAAEGIKSVVGMPSSAH